MKRFLAIGCSVVCTVFSLTAYQQWNTNPQQAYACIVLVVFVFVVGVFLEVD
jgi:hypothetical protein